MKTKLMAAAILAVGLLIVPTVVGATLITETLTITGSGFAPVLPPDTPAPVSPLTINFTVTFDNAANISPATTSGLTVHSFNLSDPVQYVYDHTADVLVVASLPFLTPGTGCDPSANTFCIFIGGISSANPSASEVLQATSSGGVWFADTISTIVVAVPAPATLALLGIGLAVIGFARRRKLH